MSDDKLLSLAAKAAGITLPHYVELGDGYYLREWNPLTDDGDALRLAVELRLCYGPNLDGDLAVVFGDDVPNLTEPYEPDPYAATRRAIVRAAAAIAKQ